MIEEMAEWPDGIYPRSEKCPHCGSTKTSVAIHGAIRQWWCQSCGQPFMPKELEQLPTANSNKDGK